MIRSAVLIMALSAAATSAPAFIAENDLVVVPGPGTEFTVPWRGVSNTRAFWCAASDYARRELGADGQTRLYRTSGRRAPGEGITFSLSPSGARKTGLLIWGGDSRGLSVAHARTFCRIPPLGE